MNSGDFMGGRGRAVVIAPKREGLRRREGCNPHPAVIPDVAHRQAQDEEMIWGPFAGQLLGR